MDAAPLLLRAGEYASRIAIDKIALRLPREGRQPDVAQVFNGLYREIHRALESGDVRRIEGEQLLGQIYFVHAPKDSRRLAPVRQAVRSAGSGARPSSISVTGRRSIQIPHAASSTAQVTRLRRIPTTSAHSPAASDPTAIGPMTASW